MSNIIIGGVKHCGKSTQGKMLAMVRSLEFVDSDEYLENLHLERTGKSENCRKIYSSYGEKYFRELEAEALEQIASDNDGDKVVALGGGAADNPYVPEDFWEDFGTFILLDVAPQVAYDRIVELGLPPFLDSAHPYEDFLRIYNDRRRRFLELADYVIEIPEECPAEEVAEKIRAVADEL